MNVHLQNEIEKLKKRILTIGAYVNDAIKDAVKSLRDRDPKLAKRVVDGDVRIDEMEVELEEECLKVLALHQPVATDLRFVVAILKINNDMERIADQASNIAERSISLADQDKMAYPEELNQMLEKTQEMLNKSLHALIEMDVDLAREVISEDDEVDDLNREIYKLTQQSISRQPERLSCFINIMSVSRQLERIADLVTNIAEDIIYMVEGEIIRHKN